MRLERVFVRAAVRLGGPANAVLGNARIRSVLRRRALRAWRDADAPLILCYGNINRSAFAVAFARGRGRAGARGAGFHSVEDRLAPARTVACAATYGVNLADHRSRRVTRADLSGADAIFVFDLENLARVAAADPPALVRTHLLGAVDDDPDVLIRDPEGRSQDVLEQTMARIARAVELIAGPDARAEVAGPGATGARSGRERPSHL